MFPVVVRLSPVSFEISLTNSDQETPNNHSGTVSQHVNRLGCLFPEHVVREAQKKVRLRRPLNNHEPETDDERRMKIREYFPQIPLDDLEAVVHHAWQTVC